MKRIIFALCIFFALVIYAVAGEFYTCTDLDGNSIFTDNPQDGMKNCVLNDSYKKPSPEERTKGKNVVEKDNAIKAKETPKTSNMHAANANDKVSNFYNNCPLACNKVYKCESDMSDHDLKDCIEYCGAMKEIFEKKIANIDDIKYQKPLKGYECIVLAKSCNAIIECKKQFDH